MKNQKILILGSSGLIGSKLSSILESDNKVYTTYNKQKLFEHDIQVDVLSFESLERAFQLSKPDIVINLCAVYNNLEFCENNKKLVMAINGTSLKDISKLSNKFSSFLIHFSSDYVFDGNSGNYKEDDLTSPINFYGVSKVESEKNVCEISKNYSIIRTSMVYGKNMIKKTLPDWILCDIQNKKQLQLISDQYMTPTYLNNLCNMVIEIISLQYNGIIHLAGPQKMSRYEFAIKMLEVMGKKYDKITAIKCADFDSNVKRPKNSSLNTEKASSILREKPESFELSINKFLKNSLHDNTYHKL
jgi:dTDP-4-dehydrorhamnose reductase